MWDLQMSFLKKVSVKSSRVTDNGSASFTFQQRPKTLVQRSPGKRVQRKFHSFSRRMKTLHSWSPFPLVWTLHVLGFELIRLFEQHLFHGMEMQPRTQLQLKTAFVAIGRAIMLYFVVCWTAKLSLQGVNVTPKICGIYWNTPTSSKYIISTNFNGVFLTLCNLHLHDRLIKTRNVCYEKQTKRIRMPMISNGKSGPSKTAPMKAKHGNSIGDEPFIFQANENLNRMMRQKLLFRDFGLLESNLAQL